MPFLNIRKWRSTCLCVCVFKPSLFIYCKFVYEPLHVQAKFNAQPRKEKIGQGNLHPWPVNHFAFEGLECWHLAFSEGPGAGEVWTEGEGSPGQVDVGHRILYYYTLQWVNCIYSLFKMRSNTVFGECTVRVVRKQSATLSDLVSLFSKIS